MCNVGSVNLQPAFLPGKETNMKATTKRKIVSFGLLGIYGALFITQHLSVYAHIALGIIMLVLVGIHLYLNKAWIKNTFKKIKTGAFKMSSLNWVTLVLSIIFIIAFISGFLAIPGIDSIGAPSVASRIHTIFGNLCLVPVILHVKKHWAGLTKSRNKKRYSETQLQTQKHMQK